MSSFLRRVTRAIRGPEPDRSGAPDERADAKRLRHVVVVGGTRRDWARRDTAEWRRNVEQLGATAASFEVPWLTLRPYDDGAGDDDETEDLGLDTWQERVETDDGACTVIIDPTADGRQQFAEAMWRLPADRAATEDAVASVLYAPAEVEPDLVLVLGPDDRLPPSVVWELAYAELVFTDSRWEELDARELEAAIAEFTTRHRRFGGLDAGTR